MAYKPPRIFSGRAPAGTREVLRIALNLGPKSSAWLTAIGIGSIEDVRALGPIEVCRRLRAAGYPVSVVMAYALEGALGGCHWNGIPWEAKQQLRTDFAKMKKVTKVGTGKSLSARKPR